MLQNPHVYSEFVTSEGVWGEDGARDKEITEACQSQAKRATAKEPSSGLVLSQGNNMEVSN